LFFIFFIDAVKENLLTVEFSLGSSNNDEKNIVEEVLYFIRFFFPFYLLIRTSLKFLKKLFPKILS
jgi:hypothetical protein